MSNLDAVKRAFERWSGRASTDAAPHVDKPTVVTTTLYADGTPAKTEVAHADGSEAPAKPADSKPYGIPPREPVPFGETGLAGREWSGGGKLPDEGVAARAQQAQAQHAERTADLAPAAPVQPGGVGVPGAPDDLGVASPEPAGQPEEPPAPTA